MDRDNGAKSRRSARIAASTLFAAAALAWLAAPASAAPVLSMSTPTEGGRTNGTPTFAGTTSDGLDVVKVLVYTGTSVGGAHRTLEATPSGTSWSVQPASNEGFTAGKYTVVAEQAELLGLLETTKTEPVTFTVDTSSPKVAITAGPEARSHTTTPSFEGSASEPTEVTVHVFEGTTEVASATTTASGGTWSTSTLSPALSEGEHSYTAYATEVSGIGNEAGKSNEVAFEVDTDPPKVAIIEGPESRSNTTTPRFSGTASENTEVVVHVYEGLNEVAKAKTVASGGSWEAASSALPTGKHAFRAYATEKSAIGNEPGTSNEVEFEVDTEAPKVAITKGPEARSNDTTPSFSGAASEDTAVTIHVFKGTTEVAKAKTTASGGSWSIETPALPPGNNNFRAYATEKSGIGNAEGESNEVTFEVDTEAPKVTITKGPEARSNKTTPSFEGTASENTQVTVHVFEGSTPIETATTTAAGGNWSVALTKALSTGKHSFRAYATEVSGISGPEGESGEVSFEVDTEAPKVAITKGPEARSNKTTPSFEGTASENTEVTVHVFEGLTEVAHVTTTASAGKWSATLSKPLSPTGNVKYSAQATEVSAINNPEGESNIVEFEVDTAPPEVTITKGPEARSNKTTPSFEGTASENAQVTVHVFEGSTPMATATATASGGKWSTSTLTKPLPTGKHSFRAYATEKSGIGNAEGESGEVTFEVNTEAPKVAITKGPEARSNKTNPSFEGTASEETLVTVHVFEGSTPITTATTTASGGKWSTSTLGKALPSGSYRAYATEKSGIGNAEGESGEVTFEVDSSAPEVAITKGPEARSNKTAPLFEGTASENTQVTVHIFEGATPMATATATASGGKWSTEALSKALPTGKHSFRAYATEVSGIGNAEGESNEVTFEVDTEAPKVAITKGPEARSNKTAPLFEGSASENTQVTVHVFEGSTPIASATTTASGGKWSATVTSGLSTGKHSYRAYATEKSGIGNAEGESNEVTFEVDTEAPKVAITKGPEARSNKTTPSFEGTASENTQVTVHVFEGTSAVETATTTAAGGNWSVALTKALSTGKHSYRAYATEKSGIGNAEGESNEVSFEVDTEAPKVAITKGPEARSNKTTPSFEGTASENTQVTVHVFEGSTPIASATTTASGGKWSTTALNKALPSGKHSFRAYATEVSGISGPEGESGEVSFEVDTEAPKVAITKGPEARSNKTTPSFEGTASENTEVTVHVFEGLTEVAHVTTTASAGKWSATLSKPLSPTGNVKYSAQATEVSAINNPEGESNIVEFEVDTAPPEVTITKGPEARSNKTTPSFEGTASENAQVTVHVFEGSTPMATATATASGGKWSTSTLTKPLPTGKHSFRAYATEKSGIGNAEGESGEVTFEVNTEAPKVAITKGPEARSNKTIPSFEGTASEETAVTVHIFENGNTNPVATATTTASGGKWSTSTVTSPLPSGKHSFSAYATEVSGVANSEGTSAPVSFAVDTEAPKVAITKGPEARSNKTTPSFEGTASEETQVTVHVYLSGSEVASAVTTASAGKWSTTTLNKPLPPGKNKFTAKATELSGIGNAEGESNEVSFEVDTEAPKVAISKAPEARSNKTTPSFEGTASENTQVTVHVFLGASEVASAVTTAAGGKWSTTTLNKPLPQGNNKFTAKASEKSGIGNAEGESNEVTFEVDTEAPKVAITNGPEARSNKTTPSFEGTASEETQVTVHVFLGASEVASAVTTAAGGKWSTTTLNKPLPQGNNKFTAKASEKSSIGNAEGESNEVSFEVDTEAPKVAISKGPEARSNKTTPHFEGTASEETPITVHVFLGSSEVASAVTTASGGKWSTSTLSKALPAGNNKFTARATEKSGIGNAEGESNEVTFEVDTEAPTVTIESPALVSNNTTPEFSGAASETTQVTVKVYKGEGTSGPVKATLVATPGAGKWKTAKVTSELLTGKYTVQATEPSSLGNPPGQSQAITFEVNTSAPTVTIEQVPPRSHVTSPAFGGTVSSTGKGPVKVEVHEGATPEGRTVAETETSLTSGHWKTAPVPLTVESGSGTFTVVARANSTLSGNPEGVSAPVTFVVYTKSPAVTLESPPSLSRFSTPSFSGATNEATPVTVVIYKGATDLGPEVTSTAPAEPSGDTWQTKPLVHPLEDGEYTAVAREESGIGNGPGESPPVTFSIRTASPKVVLNQFPTPSSDRVPIFSGTASESEPVTVSIYHEGTLVETVSASVVEGEWFSPPPVNKLNFGKYTAIATEVSSLGNPTGEAKPPFVFEVAPIPPVAITEGSASVTRTSAALYGAVNPLGGPITACNIEIGTTTAYGLKTLPCALVSEQLGFPPNAVGLLPVFIRVYGLAPNTIYHYRVVATGEGGAGTGGDMTFKTLPPLSNPEAEHPPAPPPASGTLAYASFFSTQLKPSGKGARIGALLRSGAFRFSLKAPEAGTARVRWYYVPPGAKLSAKAAKKAAPVLVASGTVSFKAAGTATMTLHLTAPGRRLLRHAKPLKLTATCAFTPTGRAAVVATRAFSLAR